MAGEFFVMESLFRLGHEPSLTLGNAKTIDILVRTISGKLYEVSVKAIQGGGKWGVGTEDYSNRGNLIFVLLYYKSFSDISTVPESFVLPAEDVEKLKRGWHNNSFAVFYYKDDRQKLEPYRNAWDKCFR